MSWSAVSCADQRAEAIADLAHSYLSEAIAPEDRAATEQVLILYLDDAETKVRAALAGAIAPFENAPRTLTWTLAQDVAEVAVEIYSTSLQLQPSDLVHAVSQGDHLIQTAIAKRNHLDGDVVRALVELGNESAILALLENETVILSAGLKHDIAVRLGDAPTVRTQLLKEAELSAATRQILVERLSGSLLAFTRDKGWASDRRLEDATHDACNRVSIDIAEQTDPSEMLDYVTHLRDSAQLTPALLVRACCMGNLALLEAALSVLSGKSLKRVQAIVDAGRVSAFRSLYSCTGLPQSAYPVFAAAVEVWQNQPDEADAISGIIAQVENNSAVDGALFALLGRMACETRREEAQHYERQLLLAAA